MIPWIMASLTVEEQSSLMSLWCKATENTMFDQWLSEWWEGMKRYHVEEAEKSTISTQSALDTLEIVLKYLPRERSGRENQETSHKMMHCETTNDDEKEKKSNNDKVNEPEDSCKVCSAFNFTSKCRWINTQKKSDPDVDEPGVPGLYPSYRDSHKLVFGCEHYKRNCKLVAACCNKLFTCRYCHDDNTDHVMDRKATTMMMCMKCLIIQPIGPTCSTVSCNNLSMARYYCRICKMFDDERKIYHCPFCNLCRVGKGLGMDYFHCMNCNACMAKALTVHICREKCLEDNCPICHEYIFTSSNPVKALPCGHVMHSSCFQEYTCSNYTCPICSKSLGDMQAYFGMLDAMLAEEKIPEEYAGRTQVQEYYAMIVRSEEHHRSIGCTINVLIVVPTTHGVSDFGYIVSAVWLSACSNMYKS
ncbi:zinc finger protein BRUTUS-like protein isoform X1 [Tanacetum coccineum]|uniref:Zinc finger protein BRUTUS-like protein isoform X1 n=1 Tax=Tanacetum coccineum TaxID=301880 RepID=A0ABQ5IZP1_9ASTR